MPSFQMLHALEERQLVSQRPRDRTQTADVLGVLPPRVVPAAIRVRYEGNAIRWHWRYLTGLRLRLARSSVEPSRIPVPDRDSPSFSTSNPRTFTTNSAGVAPFG